MKMVKIVKANLENKKFKRVTNFMNGTSYEINPLDTLKMITASSIFGEPAYYRAGMNSETTKPIKDSKYRVHNLVKQHSVVANEFLGLTTSKLMERSIDNSLSYDFLATLEWAVELRNSFFMRLNPQVIMVRASVHECREEFTKAYPGKFAEINSLVMSRGDEPSVQLTYWNYIFKDKNGIPSILKRSWAKRIASMDRYTMAKYKNKALGIIDVVRVSHASGALVDELLSTGTIEVSTSQHLTWEKMKSEGKSWHEIINTIRLPHMALLRNLRNIFSEISDLETCHTLLQQLKESVKSGKQFPYRYYTAMQVLEKADINCKPQVLSALEECMDISKSTLPELKGRTMCLSDNSGSAWGAIPSEYGSVTVAQIGNLSSALTAQMSEEGYVGLFGDGLKRVPVLKNNGVLSQAKSLNHQGQSVGMGTENGIWLFFDEAIKKKEHWDNIFIYSDQQAGHGGLYGTSQSQHHYGAKYSVDGGMYIDVLKLIKDYRKKVNPKVNVHVIQTAGYDDVVVPEYQYRTNILYGWTGKESLFAARMNAFWDEKDETNAQKKSTLS